MAGQTKSCRVATANSEHAQAKPRKIVVELSDPFLLYPPDFRRHMSAESNVPVACSYIMLERLLHENHTAS